MWSTKSFGTELQESNEACKLQWTTSLGLSILPWVTYALERSRMMLEARLIQQVQAASPEATVRVQESSHHRKAPAPEGQNERQQMETREPGGQPVPLPSQGLSYAQAARGLVVIKDNDGTTTTTTIPLSKQRKIRRGTNNKGAAQAKQSGAVANFGDMVKFLKSAANLLQSFYPGAADALRKLASLLAPLAGILPQLGDLGNIFKSSK